MLVLGCLHAVQEGGVVKQSKGNILGRGSHMRCQGCGGCVGVGERGMVFEGCHADALLLITSSDDH